MIGQITPLANSPEWRYATGHDSPGLSALCGKRVHIEWREGCGGDWHSYTVLDVDRQAGFILLHGEGDDAGPFDGRDFWARLDDVDTIEEVAG